MWNFYHEEYVLKLLWTLLLLSLSAQAEIVSFNTLNNVGKLVADEKDFNDSISRVVNGIDSYGLAPIKINIVITPSGDNASFDYGNIIYIPRSMQFFNDYGTDAVYKTTMDIISVFAHEYGHSVFDAHLGIAMPLHLQLKKIKAEISDLSIKALRSPLTDDEIKKIQAEISVKELSIRNNKGFIKLIFLTMPYAELFADTIAVYNMDSKGAIYESLYNPNVPFYKKTEREYVSARDFGQAHDLESWTMDEDHVLFSPLRSVIGSDECWPANDADRSRKLKYLSSILIADILEKNAADKRAVIEDNRNLMKKFKEFCGTK